MLNIKETESGKVMLVFGSEYKESAYRLAQLALQGFIEGKVTPSLALESADNKQSTLSLVKKRVENSVKDEISITLPKENEADIISSIIFKKIKNTYGKESPVYFTVFYKALEKECGRNLTKIHRERTDGKDKREYPYRKIDSILSVLSPQYVKEFAERYRFNKAKEAI